MTMDRYLYAVLLGGKTDDESLMEDHRMVFVAASDEASAKVSARKLWEAEEKHIDGIRRIDAVDGYRVVLAEE